MAQELLNDLLFHKTLTAKQLNTMLATNAYYCLVNMDRAYLSAEQIGCLKAVLELVAYFNESMKSDLVENVLSKDNGETEESKGENLPY